MDDLIALYCSIDDFWKAFKAEWEKHLLQSGKSKRGPSPELSIPEMMTIFILFHQSDFRTFKHFYNDYVVKQLSKEFPTLISYSRFVHLMKQLFIPLFAFILHSRGALTGISFVDSTKLQVCHNKRIPRNKVFKNLAKRGKTTAGWFYGFKLHLIINEKGEILSFLITQGNSSDVSVLEELAKGVFGKIFGDKGYISSEISKRLLEKGLQLFTTLRKGMKQKLLTLQDRILLRKRVLIETVNDQLKNISQIEHSRHRSPSNFLVNVLGGLAAYSRRPHKPCMKLDDFHGGQLPALCC
jgi:IS5 family transposase